MNDLAVVNCRQLVTLAGPRRPRTGPEMRDLAIVADGAMRVRDGRIAAVGPRSEIQRALADDDADPRTGYDRARGVHDLSLRRELVQSRFGENDGVKSFAAIDAAF